MITAARVAIASLLAAALAACHGGAPAPTTGGPATAGGPGAGGAIATGAIAGPDAAAPSGGAPAASTCPTPPAPDPLLARRRACAFGAGDRGAVTLGLDDAARRALPLRHVIVVMKENRSFDHILGAIRAVQPDADAIPDGFTNPDPHGAAVAPYHLHTTCVRQDPGHQWKAIHKDVDAGAMDGFVASAAHSIGNDGWFAMGYYDQTDLPFYYFLASTYALADHYFASVRSGTYPNRDYLLFATSGAVRQTQQHIFPDPTLLTIFDELDVAGVSWGVYADKGDEPFEGALDDPHHRWRPQREYRTTDQLLAELADGSLPSVVFVDAREGVADEHPPADVQVGEQWTKRLYDAAIASPAWSSTAILFTYDENGGFFDHVAPPTTCVARAADRAFDELGVRVPLIVISPWARRHFVSHQVAEHTSITRFIEAVFDLPALTARDANASALLDLFDFACPPAPVPPAPAAGTGGCRGPELAAAAPSFAPGAPIALTFANGAGFAKDRVVVVPRGAAADHAAALTIYVGGAARPGSGRTDGTLTLDRDHAAGAWPLPAGAWTAWFVVDDKKAKPARADFDVR